MNAPYPHELKTVINIMLTARPLWDRCWHLCGWNLVLTPLKSHVSGDLSNVILWFQSTCSTTRTPFNTAMMTKDSNMLGCDVLVFWDATIFCNNFARWLQKIVAFEAMCWFPGCYDLL
jgi:hypothetical protein